MMDSMQLVSFLTENPHLYADDWIFQQNNTAVHGACQRISSRRRLFLFWIELRIFLV